ncbi:PPC domain-containing protein, partial [Limnospira platensis]|uniref:PPC domain-containing protein n=1 Tax=Limnospira platensis TaxID=118562 RepID=UPI001562B876
STNNTNIQRAIQAGTYYVRVVPRSGNNTNYDLELGFLSQPSTTPANPGNTLRNALNLGTLSPRETLSFTEFVGVTDSSDIYQFTVNSNSDVRINLGGVTQSAEVQLIKDFNNNGEINQGDGDILALSIASSTNNTNIQRAIQAGTYYVRVVPRSGNNTNYDLELGFLSQPSTTPANPGNTLRNALNLGTLSPRETLSFTEFVGVTDSSDIYQFTVNSNSDVRINLGGVTQSAEVQLIKDFNNNGEINQGDGDILALSIASSTNNTNIQRAIQAGTYYVRVVPRSGNNTNYNLTISIE